MIIRKQPIISWLLSNTSNEHEKFIGLPMLDNLLHYGYLENALYRLADIRDENPDLGLPELLMPSFENVMKKCAKSFFKIDHELFQEFSEKEECGILLSKDIGTIVYGFGDNKLYIWIFNTENNISQLIMYFYVESTKENTRLIYTNPTIINDSQLYYGDSQDRHKFYEIITNKIIIYLAVKYYAPVETITVPINTTTKLSDQISEYKGKDKIKNESGQKVIVMDSRWFRTIVNNNLIFVSGFLRLQRRKNANGEWYKKLIYVAPHTRNGYHRKAKITDI